MNLENIDLKQHIVIKGAKMHNLKNIDVVIPRNKLVVITGVSGSGKSSLAIDTLYAEGQRRYIESISSYMRQFFARLDKPAVDYIKGICPAIAIEQKVVTRSARSTVGTLTELYDYLRLLFSRIGVTYSPISENEVKRHTVSNVVDFIIEQPEGSKIQLGPAFILREAKTIEEELKILLQKGFNRLIINSNLTNIENILENIPQYNTINSQNCHILIDRFIVNQNDLELSSRIADSVQTAFFEGHGECTIFVAPPNSNVYKPFNFSNKFEIDGLSFEEPTPQFFNFNNSYGACPKCEGHGQTIDLDVNLIIPDKNLSLFDNAVAPWKSEKMQIWKDQFIKAAHLFDFPIHKPINKLTNSQYHTLWEGNQHVNGINQFFNMLNANNFDMHYRILLARYKSRVLCPSCKGNRLRPDTEYVKINKTTIGHILNLPIVELKLYFDNLKLNAYHTAIAERIITEINQRINIMVNIGLGYLTLNRPSNTLSGGETQRINLTRSLGSNLSNSMYILDEPSIGLHSFDNQQLIEVLKQLRNLGNTVIVIEHDEDMMRQADYLIDMGKFAGKLGGEVVYANLPIHLNTANTLTAKYLNGSLKIEVPTQRRKFVNRIVIEEATQNNLKNVTATFPLQVITVVTGVSGSGKSTLVKKILYPALQRALKIEGAEIPGQHTAIKGDTNSIFEVEMIDQNPLGKSTRSNPVTYIKAYDSIRDLFCEQNLSKIRGFTAKHFSFNVEGGRCETCKGNGTIEVEMQFLANVKLPCEDCNGKRFKAEVLEVLYNNKNINDVLNMTIEDAMSFFEPRKEIVKRLQPLIDVGLGYIQLGQSSDTLSGGEAQRVKLALYLGRGKALKPVFFIFDEPSTGLHFYDIKILLKAFNALVDNGHTLVIVEHNLDIIKCADWLLDLGPKGGSEGGYLLYEGVPEGLLKCKKSITAPYLKQKLK